MADVAISLGERFGFDVQVFDKQQLIELGCGGLLGVNSGSAEEPRMIKLRYTPPSDSTGHLGLVGKGIMYDSGGISLKPSDPMHLLMKMDMGGAASVLATFTALRALHATATVSGWLMCTDNMPSGSAYKLGDVLTARGGTTVEVKNTDAEGRLVMMDAIVLANEDGVDAIVDIATLTGAALMALGPSIAALFGNDGGVAGLVEQAPPRRPTRRSGACRSSASTASSSIRMSPTSRTSEAPTPGRRPRRCSSTTSSARRRGRTSTSPARCSPTPTTRGDRRAPPASARASSSRSPGSSARRSDRPRSDGSSTSRARQRAGPASTAGFRAALAR